MLSPSEGFPSPAITNGFNFLFHILFKNEYLILLTFLLCIFLLFVIFKLVIESMSNFIPAEVSLAEGFGWNVNDVFI